MEKHLRRGLEEEVSWALLLLHKHSEDSLATHQLISQRSHPTQRTFCLLTLHALPAFSSSLTTTGFAGIPFLCEREFHAKRMLCSESWYVAWSGSQDQEAGRKEWAAARVQVEGTARWR